MYYLWLKENKFYSFAVNSPMHSIESLGFYRFFYNNCNIFEILREFLRPSYWPRLNYVFTGFAINLFGRSYISMGLVNIFYLFILMFSVYGISFKITQNTYISICSAAFVSLYPGIIKFTGFYELQLGVAAFTSISVYFLVLSNNLKSTFFCILFTLFFCLAMYMDRFCPLVFVLGPFLYVLNNSIKEMSGKKFVKEILPNVLMIIIVTTILLKPFYLQWLFSLDYNDLFSQGGVSGISIWKEFINASIFVSLSRLFFYLNMLPGYHLGIFWTAVFLCAIYGYIKSPYRYKYLLWWWFLVPVIFFSFLPKKNLSYIIAALAPVGIITSIGLSVVANKAKRIFIYALILLFGLLQFFIVRFAPNETSDKLFLLSHINNDVTIANIGSTRHNNEVTAWISNEVIKYFPSDKRLSLAILKDEYGFGPLDFELGVSLLLRNPLNEVCLLYLEDELDNFSENKCDYIIVISNKESIFTLGQIIKNAFSFRKRNRIVKVSEYSLVEQMDYCIFSVRVKIYKKNR